VVFSLQFPHLPSSILQALLGFPEARWIFFGYCVASGVYPDLVDRHFPHCDSCERVICPDQTQVRILSNWRKKALYRVVTETDVSFGHLDDYRGRS
jgi:hypothetical protein